MTVKMRGNDGRKPFGYLPTLVFAEGVRPVVQVKNQNTGEVLYTIRVDSNRFDAPVYESGKYSVLIDANKPSLNGKVISNFLPGKKGRGSIKVDLNQ